MGTWPGPSIASSGSDADASGPYARAMMSPARARRNVLVMAAIAVGVTLFCLYSHGEGEAYDKRLATEGRTTTGRITEVWEHWARGGRSYIARYEYFVRGKRYEWSKSVQRDEAMSLSKGDFVPVTYLPSEPGRSIGKSLQEHKAEMASGSRAQVFICGGLWASVLLGVVMQLARRRSA